jgi:hypothetical protein
MNKAQSKSADEEMQRYALEAKQHPQHSKERQIALTKLIEALARSGKLSRPRKGEFVSVYEDIYAEALSLLWLFICENIDKYDPQRASVITWVNYLLNKRFIIEAIKIVVGKKEVLRSDTLEIEFLPHRSREPSMSEVLRQYLQEDPQQVFTNKSLVNRPDVNFKQIALARLSGKKWKTISAELDVKTSTLSDFYQRCLKEFKPLFQEILTNDY